MLLDPAFAVAVVVLTGIFGTIIGSFLNVVVWRLPRGESLSHPGSACPNCGHPIRWWDNIPVVSWIVLRGKCRDCGAPISSRYVLVETATGLFFAGIAFWILSGGLGLVEPVALILAGVAFLYLASISVALALIDLDTHTLPNRIVLPSYIVGAVLIVAASLVEGDLGSLIRAGIGLAAMFAAYFLMAIAYPGGMGFGDVKLAGVLGLYLAWLGWGELAIGFFAAFVLGGVFSLVLILAKKASRKSGIPFGPWMLVGAWVGIFVGDAIARGYLALFGLAL
ncbi:prepilin peptidase [Glaciihabitans arcticus]|uniref:Prepilin leader peptidase/N-methyltransferase n=1 Tax=Glaciihabitans arcticus TaxID=2668039 RepID=A0A4Q9GT68_9MICO|nr:A24 family peptidase [Glaciihabitans arcticus]TBN57845.1 prepilin peptidase [Glaciihabitans arcticus]